MPDKRLAGSAQGVPLGGKLDAPFYTLASDGRHIHVCTMPYHTSYWLNVGAKLWVCDRCHPAPEGANVEVKRVEELEREKVNQ